MIISISGAHGSGKTTVAKQLAKKLGWPHYSMGGLRREAAKKAGLTLAEYNKLGENNPKTDKIVDNYQKKLGKTQDNFIIDGRISWFFIPHSYKIYLDAKPETAAKRIWLDLKKDNNKRNEDQGLKKEADVLLSLKQRLKSDNLRYKKYYNINIHLKKNYNFYLDTTKLTERQVLSQIYSKIKSNIDKS